MRVVKIVAALVALALMASDAKAGFFQRAKERKAQRQAAHAAPATSTTCGSCTTCQACTPQGVTATQPPARVYRAAVAAPVVRVLTGGACANGVCPK